MALTQNEEEDLLATMFRDFDKVTEKLDKIPQSAKTKTDALLELFFSNDDKPVDIFSLQKQKQFLKKLNDLSGEVGHAYHTVLSIELARQSIAPQQIESSELPKPSQAQTSGQPITINAAPPQQLGVLSGAWYYGAESKRSKAIVEIAKLQQQQNVPQISTATPVLDILDFGRQLIPEFNRVQEYYQHALEQVQFFPDDWTRDRLTAELRKHLNKLAGIIRAFCQTICEYRKDLVHEGKKDVAKALMALKMAEAQSLGGMRMSDFYKAMRDAAGPQDAGR